MAYDVVHFLIVSIGFMFISSSGRCWSSDTYNPCPGVMEVGRILFSPAVLRIDTSLPCYLPRTYPPAEATPAALVLP